MKRRSLAQWLSFIEQSHPKEIELGLDRVAEVAARLQLDASSARVITVAGTNGKGSCVAVCEALLIAAGQKVGVYTSPHLQRYNERVRIGGEEVSDALLAEAFATVHEAAGSTTLTYFEYGTLAALWLFMRGSLDVWVLEVGLGGRLDAVNIIDADVAVITRIDIDHIDWLGNDRDSIAAEKAGILRAGKSAVCADREPPASLRSIVEERSVRMHWIGRDFDVEQTDPLIWRWRGADDGAMASSSAPLNGIIADNAVAAVQAVALLDALPDTDTMSRLLPQITVPGRRQRITVDRIKCILDVAHNPAGMRALVDWLQASGASPDVIVFAAMADKDLDGLLQPLAGIASRWMLPRLALPRACEPGLLAKQITELNAAATCEIDSAVEHALKSAFELAGPGGTVLVCGSFFVVGPALDCLNAMLDTQGE